jgi:hypothetical protein
MNLDHCIDGAAAGKLKPDPKFSGLSLLVVTRPRSSGPFLSAQQVWQLRDIGRDPPRLLPRDTRPRLNLCDQ